MSQTQNSPHILPLLFIYSPFTLVAGNIAKVTFVLVFTPGITRMIH
jgi:hypothetical protein